MQSIQAEFCNTKAGEVANTPMLSHRSLGVHAQIIIFTDLIGLLSHQTLPYGIMAKHIFKAAKARSLACLFRSGSIDWISSISYSMLQTSNRSNTAMSPRGRVWPNGTNSSDLYFSSMCLILHPERKPRDSIFFTSCECTRRRHQKGGREMRVK